MELSFVIVNFQSKSFLEKCLDSIKNKLKNCSYEIIVVNNDKDEIFDDAEFDQSVVTIINMPKNVGFATACNVGAQKSKGDYIFFLNPDTELMFSNCKDLLSFFKKQDIGIISPQLVLGDGLMQAWSWGIALTPFSLLKNQLLKKQASIPEENGASTIRVDWVSGAALIISKNLFERCGGFDENFFMYFEDIDLCRRVRLLGYEILNIPQFSILHIGGQSYFDKKIQKKQYYKSQNYYFKKHFGFISMFMVASLRGLFLLIKK